jgi:alkanesulfonate monooxygenase SsuD/methylene tetrahydromethanopterin reductase-like flavin-dependent oxidoreductase (luciferase family)
LGRWIRYRDVGANPLPLQKPHIPIWIGGKTPAALRRVARYGSGYHTITSTPAQVAAEVRDVRAELERAGRDPDEIVVSMLWAGLEVRGVAQTLDAIGEYARAGMHHLVGIPWLLERNPTKLSGADLLAATLENMRVFASDVLPRVPRTGLST